MATPPEENWYIVKQDSEKCVILSAVELEALNETDTTVTETTAEITTETTDSPSVLEQWGPFKAKNQAIAKRVGLIRAGKCQPAL